MSTGRVESMAWLLSRRRWLNLGSMQVPSLESGSAGGTNVQRGREEEEDLMSDERRSLRCGGALTCQQTTVPLHQQTNNTMQQM